jgi:hypothetical protein
LLALGLAALRLRHAAAWSLAATGLGFVLVKTTESGAQLASAAWSFITPSVVLRDPTDLLAHPALAVAWWSHRWARRSHLPHRRRAMVAAGALVLPFAVVATAATSCVAPEGVRAVDVYEGQFVDSSATQRRLVAHFEGYSNNLAVASDGTVTPCARTTPPVSTGGAPGPSRGPRARPRHRRGAGEEAEATRWWKPAPTRD